MGGQAGPSSIAYYYDAHGHITQTRRRIFNREQLIETTYNHHGDKELEVTREEQIGEQYGQEDPAPRPLEYSEVRYSYEYDEAGNWTKESVSYRSKPSGDFQLSSERQRILSYN